MGANSNISGYEYLQRRIICLFLMNLNMKRVSQYRAYRFCWKNFWCFLRNCWRDDLWRRFYRTFYSFLSVFLYVTTCFPSILNLSLNYLHFSSRLLRIVAFLRLNLTVLKQAVVKYTDVNAVFLKREVSLACLYRPKKDLTYLYNWSDHGNCLATS